MKKIKLTRGKWAIVDDADYKWLSQWKWYCSTKGYAERDEGYGKHRKRIFMHRLINDTPDGLLTDHINRNQLDNRRCNLRDATPRQNSINRKIPITNKSGYIGVFWNFGSWQAAIKVNNKYINLGRFKNIMDAVKARKRGELIYQKI